MKEVLHAMIFAMLLNTAYRLIGVEEPYIAILFFLILIVIKLDKQYTVRGTLRKIVINLFCRSKYWDPWVEHSYVEDRF